MKRHLIFIGHRGTRTKCDENTLHAFETALKYSADCIEFDIHKTKDNKLIVIHDLSLNRTTNGSGFIEDLSYEELSKFRSKNKKEQIPLLTTVLEEFKGKTKFMIELKGLGVKKVLLDVINEKMLIKDVIFSGRNLNELKSIKISFPSSKICYNITKGKGLTISDFIRFDTQRKLSFKIDMISLRSSLITSEFIKTCHENNILALSWDFLCYDDPLDKIKSLIKRGIDGILFDNYKNILKIRNWLEKS